MTKAVHLARLHAAAAAPLARAETRVAILTGQVRLDTSPLSAAQLAFLDAVATPGMDIIRTGFPYEAGENASFEMPPMPQAALVNARQYLWAHHDARYRDLARASLQRLVAATDRALVLITGSCGLAILNAARLEASRLHVLALGPAGSAPRTHAFRAVQGKGDAWSHVLYRGPAPTRIACGHMDYWAAPEASAIAREFVHTAARA